MADFADKLNCSTKIKSIKLTDSTVLRVTVNEFKDGTVKIDIRQWYRKKGQKEWMPGKGMSIDPDNAGPLRVALRKAEEFASGC